ncbi:hypothetical protein PybrP1_003530 [[Pythium] brassicae (nom. inval.)]|nr:hypothetical protein PybrP1_003530 [[Pythium] brassicae (nom. inval.)]
MNTAPPSGSASAAAIAASLAPAGTKRRFADPEYIAISEFLSSVGEVDEQDAHGGLPSSSSSMSSSSQAARKNDVAVVAAALQHKRARSAAAAAAASAKRSGAHENKVLAQSHGAYGGRHDSNGARDSAQEALEQSPGRPSSAGTSDRRSTAGAGGSKASAKASPVGALSGAEDVDDNQSDRSDKSAAELRVATSRHTKLTKLEARVRRLERDNLHLKQTLLLGKNGSAMIAGRGSRDAIQRLLSERTKVVTEMVEQLNAAVLTVDDAARVWHAQCRVGVGVREWDAFGRVQTISLWHMIRSVFSTIAVDIVELRPHLPDGEMILTKWRVQGEIASAAQLEAVCASEDCPATMRVALQAIKSSDLTFTVTTYVIFQDGQIAEQHHCWDQVGVFKRLFGGEIPPAVQQMLAIP